MVCTQVVLRLHNWTHRKEEQWCYCEDQGLDNQPSPGSKGGPPGRVPRISPQPVRPRSSGEVGTGGYGGRGSRAMWARDAEF